MTVRFRYVDLLLTSRNRPPGYLEEVLRLGWRRGTEVCLSEDAYRMLCLKYAPKEVEALRARPLTKHVPVDVCCGQPTPALTT